MRAVPVTSHPRRIRLLLPGLAAVALAAPWLAGAAGPERGSFRMPWKQAGLTERQAAAHLLDRFAFGPRPGEVDEAVAMGLERWLERQLAGDLPDARLAAHLATYPALPMSTAELLRIYPLPATVLAEARQAGVVPAKNDGAAGQAAAGQGDLDKEDIKEKVRVFARQRGYRQEKELLGQLMAQKVLRAVYSENQLGEVMTDFWFNHFNVSLTNNRTRPYLLAYERDAIRPNALGRFRDLLGATAHQPAMLLYLDNAQSTATAEAETTMADEMERRPVARFARPGARRGPFAARPGAAPAAGAANAAKKAERGLNENYARELMELHTLGVDGGYTQKDVIEVARAFTGWTVVPPGPARAKLEQRLERAERAGGLGFWQQGEFLFRADVHDAGEKTILGRRFPAGRGIEDGEQVLDILAAHPATARHLASQLAVRFVSDHPPQALVDRLAEVYRTSGGDIRAMLRAIAASPEFWSREALAAKIKSPFELASSAIRALGGEVGEPRATIEWIGRIGEPLYAYQAPTGYPDRAEAWVNTGSLLARMNFGMQLAAGRVPGVQVDLAALNGGHEPESREQALAVYAGLLMPGRDLAPTLKLLQPLVASPDLARRVDQAAPATAGTPAEKPAGMPPEKLSGKPAASADEALAAALFTDPSDERAMKGRPRTAAERPPAPQAPPTPLQQVVGVILGSPEFQRR
jgi:uncharacterized protein (DUF1800 family)